MFSIEPDVCSNTMGRANQRIQAIQKGPRTCLSERLMLFVSTTPCGGTCVEIPPLTATRRAGLPVRASRRQVGAEEQGDAEGDDANQVCRDGVGMGCGAGAACDIRTVQSRVPRDGAQGRENHHDLYPCWSEPAPLSSERAPLSSEGAPLSSEGAPLSSERAPVSSERAPVSSERAPPSSERAPLSSEAAPLFCQTFTGRNESFAGRNERPTGWCQKARN